MPRKYRNPPVVEAVCEFRFEPSSAWDLAVPGLVYERLQETYPEREQVRAVESAIQVSEEGVQQNVTTANRVRFRSAGGEALVQVGEHLLSANHLAPYPTWEAFRPMVLEAFEVYRSVAAPTGIDRVGLRYINRISIPGDTVELEDYFRLYPEIGDSLEDRAFTSFLMGIQWPFDEERDLLRLQFASGEPDQPGSVVALLDLDYFLAQPGELRFEDLEAWLEQAHGRVEDVFEGCLRDDLRNLFGVEV